MVLVKIDKRPFICIENLRLMLFICIEIKVRGYGVYNVINSGIRPMSHVYFYFCKVS